MAITVSQLLKNTLLSHAEALILLAHVLTWERTALITRDQEPLPLHAIELFKTLEARRLKGEPIAYLTGYREFYDLKLYVTADVLIPRPETELLVDTALKHCSALIGQGIYPKILELGTGSGAIALAIATTCPKARLIAVDISEKALAVARLNTTHLSVKHPELEKRIDWRSSDWFSKIMPHECFDIIISNPPYIAQQDPHLSQGDLRFEPLQALTDHSDGLSAYKKIIQIGPLHLQPAGLLLLEHGYNQAEAIRKMLLDAKLEHIFTLRDLGQHERVTGACTTGKAS